MKARRFLPLLGLGLALLLAACGGQTGGGGGGSGSGGGGGGGAAPSFTIALNPTSLTVQQGSEGTVRLTLTPQNGFTGTVSLSLVAGQDGVPQGLTLSPESVQVSGASPVSQVLTLSVQANTPTGTYRLKVRATSGSLTREADLTVTVSASGGGGGGGGGGDGGNTVTVRQLDTAPLVGAYYRTGGGSWQALTFTGGQATFTASGDYEVAVRCQSGGLAQVQLFKATPAQTRTVVFACGGGGSGGGVQKEFDVTLPASIGGSSVQAGDYVFVGRSSGEYTGSNPVTMYSFLPDGRQDVLLTVLRPVGNPLTSVTPIGYKLVNLDLTGPGPFAVDATGWQPFSAVRTITLNPPPGFSSPPGAPAVVYFFKDGMKEPTIVGGFDRYGTLATSGKYLGLSGVRRDASEDILFALKETGGANWSVSFPDPWATGQFSVSGDILTFNHPQAQAYVLSASGLLEDSGTGSPLRVEITLYGGGNVSYTVPVVSGLSYRLADPATRSVAFDLNAFRGDPARFLNIFLGGGFSESALAGLDLSWAQRQGSFTGSSYTLP
jgi:hypothetical protein